MGRVSRRQFLQTTGAGLLGLAIPFDRFVPGSGKSVYGRVTRSEIKVYRQPDFQSEVAGRKRRDEILHLYYPVEVEGGTNPLWYRAWDGYVHSAYLQPVDLQVNPVAERLNPNGQPATVTVPFTDSATYHPYRGWETIYRLYYGSIHWVHEVVDGPDHTPWYLLTDSYERISYAPASHLRLLAEGDIAPISPDVPPGEKRIEVSIRQQALWAYEGDRLVLSTRISSGVPQQGDIPPGEVSTETPAGHFHITVKTFSRHMGRTPMTAEFDTGAYPGVPWVNFFHQDGYSFHGTYWHSNFGIRMSHGCVNMLTSEAQWLFRWTTPAITLEERQVSDWGTRVVVYE